MHWVVQAAWLGLRSRWVRRLLVVSLVMAAVAALVVGLTLGGLLALLAGRGGESQALGLACAGADVIPAVLTGDGDGGQSGSKVAGLDAEQLATAAAIVTEGQRLNLPDYGLVVAVATARQESGLRPLRFGDRDSLGPFQQRAGWGSPAERIDPTTSARLFFTGGRGGQRGLLGVAGYQRLAVTVAAQTVQLSAYPDAYADDEAPARQIVSALLDRALSVADTAACSVTAGGAAEPGTRCEPSGLAAEQGLQPSALQVLRC